MTDPPLARHADLTPTLYADLRSLAAAYMRRERREHTLQATALVHEAYLRIMRSAPGDYGATRQQLFCAMSVSMRRILVDYARRRSAVKRAGAPSTPAVESQYRLAADILALDDALDVLERLNPRHAKVVELRYFAGLTIEEAADVLEVSPETVKLDWRFAKAWLLSRLDPRQASAFSDR